MHEIYTAHANGGLAGLADRGSTDRGSTNSYANRHTNGHRSKQQARVALLLANATDCDTLSNLLSQHERIEVLAAGADVDFGLARCRRLCPQLLILDPKVSADALPCAIEMVSRLQIQHLLVLDDRLYEGRLASLLPMPAVSYLTRQAGFEALQAATLKIVSEGQRLFEPAVQERLCRTRSGLKLQKRSGRPSVAELTSRELEVMKILATGYSVRDCAEQLQLAESTIDNHKSRLMKKLDIHKTVQMTHFAIREGLIVV